METKGEGVNQISLCSFKSYYVVWKPYEVTQANDGRFQFKSYYVVWKPRGNDEICGKIFCLNRTM